jgi:hypothetical protein
LAGSRVNCACGKEVVVPALSALKNSVGRSALGIQFRIRDLLDRGVLPRESTCLLCKLPSTNTVHCWATCLRPYVKPRPGILKYVVLGVLFGLAGVFFGMADERDDEVHGEDVRLRLPLRVCGNCAEQLHDTLLLKETLLDVPIYAELLERYPGTDVSLDIGLADLTPWEKK